ncbi:unnamed protein product [Closterium sp. NIES-53]
MVLNRCVSPPIRISISGFSQEKAGQLAWAYILSTYQARDALHTSLLQTQLAQLKKGDDETVESYCNRARTIRAELLAIGQEVHMATFAAHMLKGLPLEYRFLRRKLDISSPDMTVERVCNEVLMEEQTLSIEQSYKQITSDASAFSGTVKTIVATTGVKGKEGKGGREQTDKKKDGKREEKQGPFKGHCYNCNEEGHMAAKCPIKKKDATPMAAANVAEGDGKGVALTVALAAAACNDTAAGAACNGTMAAVTCNGMTKAVADGAASLKTEADSHERWRLGMDLEKGGEDMPCTSCHEAKLTRKSFPLHDEREEQVLGLAHTDVCSPFQTPAVDGSKYYILFVEHASFPSLFPEPRDPKQNPSPPRTVIVVPVLSVQGGEQPLDCSVVPLGNKAPTAPPPLSPPSVADSAPMGPEDGPLEVGTSMTDHKEEEEEEYPDEDEEEGTWGGVILDLAAALTGPESKEWWAAMKEEMESLDEQGTWMLAELPEGRKTVGVKWLLKKKLWPDGTVEKYKAKLVAKGFSQRFGVDYNDTYAPVGNYTTVRVFLSITVAMDLDLLQLDVKKAFLHGTIDHEIYIQQPPYFTDGSSKVCLLQKSLYWLKHSPLLWYKELDKVLLVEGYKKSLVDQALYYKDGASGKRVWLIIYVDDLLAASEDQQLLQDLKELLAKAF